MIENPKHKSGLRHNLANGSRAVARGLLATTAIGLFGATPAIASNTKEQKQVQSRMTEMVKHFGHKILVFSQHHKADTNKYYGHGKEGVGLSVSVSSTVAPPKDGNGQPIAYGATVTYGYNRRSHTTDWNDIKGITEYESEFTLRAPDVDLEIIENSETGAIYVDNSYSQLTGKPFAYSFGSTDRRDGKQLTLAGVNTLGHQLQAVLNEQSSTSIDERSHPEFFAPLPF